ncbi:MAG: sugar phosphate isomerase/epimerase, partial [Planctomycetes bacterium]|nr:sugar phosphate isomerase/epimerase [Planctomycetota bacterium]
GFQFAEVGPTLIPLDLAADRLSKIQGSFRAARIRLDAYGIVPFRKDDPSAAAARPFAVAKRLGIFTIAADADPEVLPELDARADEFGIRVAVVNGGPGHRFATPEALEPALRDLSGRAGVCIDAANALRAGVDPVELVDLFGKRVLGVHLRDYDVKGKNFAPVGQGSLRLLPFLKALREVRFAGFFSIQGEGDDPLPGIRAALEGLEKAAKELPPPELPFPRTGRLPRTPAAPEPKGSS